MDPITIFTSILEFVKGRQSQDAAKDLEQIKALSAEAVVFTQATTPDYAKVAPWVNTVVALMRPGLTVILVIGHYLRPDVVTEGLVKLSVGSWFVSRGAEKVAAILSNGGGRNGAGGQQPSSNAPNGHN